MNNFMNTYYVNRFNIFVLLILIYSINTQLLNNIIKLGDAGFRYSYFSYNMNGDMLIDTTAYPINKERKFFGLKNNGEFFFINENNEKTAYYSTTMAHGNGKIEGGSAFIKLTSSNSIYHGKELFCEISKYYTNTIGDYVEIYNLNHKNYTYYKTSTIFGRIFSDFVSILKSPEDNDSQYLYTIAYIVVNSNNYFFNIKQTYFTFDISDGYVHTKELSYEAQQHMGISCFYTEKSKHICFYLDNNYYLVIIVHKSDFSTEPVNTNVYKANNYGKSTFFKGIHLKDEIGFFIYFKLSTTSPTISLYQCDENNNMVPYSNFLEINVNKATYNQDVDLNDVIKLNNYQVCYLSTSSNKYYFQISVFTLYKNDELMNIRYYEIEAWTTYTIKIFLNIKSSLYKNFISLTFSHCSQESCSSPTGDKYYASLIIFSYPNSTDNSLDIIPLLYHSNQEIENDFSFNLEGTFTIENNLFGLVYKGIRIMKYYSELSFTNITTKNILEEGTVVLKNENISLFFETHEIYEKNNYIVEYAIVLEEDDYDVIGNYISDIDESYGNKIEDEKNYYQRYEYTGKSSNYSIIIDEKLLSDCNDDSCSLCFSNNTCLTCRYNYTFNNNEKQCLPNPYIKTTIPTTIPTTTPTTTPNTIPKLISTELLSIISNTITNNPTTIPQVQNIPTTYLSQYDKILKTIPVTILQIGNYTIEQIIKGYYNGKVTNEQIVEIYNILKQNISANSSSLIQTENAIFQLTSVEEQKNSNNPNVSSVDLGKCEQLIKEQEGLSESQDLIILKTDIKNEDLTSTYVQYEIYNPITLKFISLDICKNISISVSIPITLEEKTESTYAILSQSGYNLFDLNDSFYNDICSTYTTENGTDLTLVDRKNIIYDNNGNISMCQEGCTFQSYNLTSKKATCDCEVQTKENITDLNEINFDKNELVDNFFDTLKNSNFLVLKCFNLVFSLKGQKDNIGSYFMTGNTFIYIILLIIYIIKGNKKLNYYISIILKQKFNSKQKPINKLSKSIHFPKTVNKTNNRNNNIKETHSKEKKKNIKKSKFNKNINNKNKKPIKHKSSKHLISNYPPKKKLNINININYKKLKSDKLMILNSNILERTKTKNNLLEFNKTRININKKPKNNQKYNNLLTKSKNKILTSKSVKIFTEKNEIKNLNDEELNNLEYEKAIVFDKRTYFQYYFSLLKKKQLIAFAFYPANDYNLITVKVSLLLISFSLYFTINGFFFSDETMNKINEDKGVYNILFQIPQILYSTIISAIINMILKKLSLSEQQILLLKSEKNFLAAQNKSKNIKTCLKIKLSIFFLLSFILMVFFWYFISCFCAVYNNTQKILIKDTLLSFTLSMLYPFGLNLVPGIFRIPAIKAIKKDKKCLYKISRIIALI